MGANPCAIGSVAHHHVVKAPCGQEIHTPSKRINFWEPFVDTLNEETPLAVSQKIGIDERSLLELPLVRQATDNATVYLILHGQSREFLGADG